MSRLMCFTMWRKISPPFGRFTPAAGRGFSLGPILCLCGANFAVAWLGRGREKRGEIGGSPPHNVHGGQPGALLALPKAGNCHDPHFDTLGNGFILGNFHACDPWFDPKACLPTHTDFCSTTHTFRSPVRWHLSWHRCLWLGSWRNPHKRRRSWRQARKTGTVLSRISRP